MDYRATLHLPKTEFPMRANLPEREPQWLAQWKALDLYGQLRSLRRGQEKFVLHDGPPYANGDIHTGTALNKIVKDLINRYWGFQGYDVPYIPGWDTHGLPIELRALKQLGVSQHQIDPLTLRRECAKVARHFIPLMTTEFQRLGVLADWDHPYVTMDPAYEAGELRMFAEMVAKGLIYRGLMPVYWCPHCETALADAEIEYHPQIADALWVAFELAPRDGMPDAVRAVIWTTTPWTLPANVAIALHPDLAYLVVGTEAGNLLVAETRAEATLQTLGLTARERWGPFSGRSLEGWQARHPYLDRPSPLILGQFVTDESGTGLVHTAPGHGMDDYLAASAYGLPMLQPLNGQGVFEEGTPVTGGLFYRDANSVIVETLRQRGALLGAERPSHQNTFCWRCKNPVIYRATEQWFMSIQKIRSALLDAAETVQWDPAWGLERMRGMVRDRRDWCLSRQRAYGVPIPAFYCEDCHQVLLTPELIRRVAERIEELGSDVWWEEPAAAFLPAGYCCPGCGGTRFRKEKDVFDVWMDSGASQTVLEKRGELKWPADLILEGGDQYRGWFMALLTEAVAVHGKAPYRGVLSHGWVLDKAGQEMHKSLGNTVDPLELVDRYGADIVRLWVAAGEFRSDVRISEDLMRQMAETYRKIRNTMRFLLGNLADYEPAEDVAAPPIADPLNRWAIWTVDQWLTGADQAYRQYQFHTVVHGVIRLVTLDLSNVYLDVVKDRLYTLAGDDPLRRETQGVLYHILRVLTISLAPILVFTSEEIYQVMRQRAGGLDSVHLETWPRRANLTYSDAEAFRMTRLLRQREAILKALETLRESKEIGNSLEAEVVLTVPSAEWTLCEEGDTDLLTEMTMTAGVTLEEGDVLIAKAQRTTYQRCERCWRHTADVGQSEPRGLCRRCVEVLAVEEPSR